MDEDQHPTRRYIVGGGGAAISDMQVAVEQREAISVWRREGWHRCNVILGAAGRDRLSVGSE